MGGMILFCLSMSLTSCEDILGEWSRPTPNPVTPGGGGSSTINATAITLGQTLKVFKSGDAALTITVTATPSDATFTWESSDANVATVENGVVTPVGAGIATITAKSGDVTATCEVFVGNEVDLATKTANYTVQNYDILKGTLDPSYAISIPNDSKVTFNGMKTTQQITCSGDATIILADGSTNTVDASGINNQAAIPIGGTGKTLTIDAETEGTGTLTAKGGSDAAGIGTSKDETGGNIVIEGGVIEATGGDHAAGIGTGNAESNNNECGSITINGGTVTAKGVNGGAGIGTGVANYGTNTCGAITINGGTVTATGGGDAAGIGTGYSFNAKNECGAITIDTGVTKVTATKGAGSPNSIGTGTNGVTQKCGDIYFDIKVATAGAYTITTTDGTYTHGGLNLVISGNDWKLTPVAP